MTDDMTDDWWPDLDAADLAALAERDPWAGSDSEVLVRFFMIGTAPRPESVSFGVDLRRRNGYWHWWVPGRPHTFRGLPPVDEHDGWRRLPSESAGWDDLWFKEFGIWAKPVVPGLHNLNTDAEALAFAERFWRAEPQ